MGRVIETRGLAKSYTIEKGPFSALLPLDLSIEEGEVVGVIGPNGSGKSTLLKLLSRVTYPSEGELHIHGRVAALLEVGVGFHPELTGRENIYLSGALLGMRKREVKAHYDEIVAFAGVESFLNTPVKYYSSGMFVRLAFSVMTHLKSQVYLIDEVIAVGDLEFQARCVEKLFSLRDEGKTVLLVSHQLDKIQELCTRGLWFEKGVLIADGEVEPIMEAYTCKAALHQGAGQ